MREILVISVAVLASLALPGCTQPTSSGPASILLFSGTGTSPNDVKAILSDNGLGYRSVNTQQLNDMSQAQLMAYRLLIIPGGNYIEMGDAIAPSAITNVREAVRDGMNYLGICAGALLAGDAPHNGLNLTSGVRFDFLCGCESGNP